MWLWLHSWLSMRSACWGFNVCTFFFLFPVFFGRVCTSKESGSRQLKRGTADQHMLHRWHHSPLPAHLISPLCCHDLSALAPSPLSLFTVHCSLFTSSSLVPRPSFLLPPPPSLLPTPL